MENGSRRVCLNSVIKPNDRVMEGSILITFMNEKDGEQTVELRATGSRDLVRGVEYGQKRGI